VQTPEIAFMFNRHSLIAIQVVVLTPNADFEELVRAAFGFGAKFSLSVVKGGLLSDGATLDVAGAGVVIVDLDSTQTEEFLALDLLTRRIAGSAPVVVVTQALHESVPRRLVQMRIADFLVKPVAATELLAACVRVAQTPTGGALKEAEILAFMPAVGGAGVTTIAIQAALTLHRGGSATARSTCLVDLNLAHSACAHYLDLKPRLDLREIEPRPERLDRHLLEVMLSRHSSGLSVIAAPNSLAGMHSVSPTVVTRLLDLVSSTFDNVVIDMPRTWFPWSDDVLCGSNRVFIVGEATVPALRCAKKLAAATSQRLGLRSRPLVIVNRFQQRLFSPGLRRADIKLALGEFFGGTIPCNHRLVREAIDRGVPLEEVKRRNNIAAAVNKLILGRDRGGSTSHAPHRSAAVALAA
jgi:pilus assembly protein CpaE